MQRALVFLALVFVSVRALSQLTLSPKVQVPASPSSTSSAVSGTATDDDWAIVWSQSDGVFGARLNRDATSFGNRFQVTNAAARLTSAGWSGTRLLVAWIDSVSFPGPLKLRSVFEDLPENHERVIDSSPTFDVQVKGSAYGAALVWSTGTEIRAMRLNRDGEQMDYAPVRLDRSTANKSEVNVGVANDSYQIAWVEADNNPAYPCRLNACPAYSEIRMVACRLEPSGAGPIFILKSFVPVSALPDTGPYPHAFAWSPRSGLFFWDELTAKLMIPVSEDFRPGVPVVLSNGIANAQFDGRNFLVCSYTGSADANLLIVSQFGALYVDSGLTVPYGQIVAGVNGKALLIGKSIDDGGLSRAYAALVVDNWHFAEQRRRSVRH